MKIGSCLRLVAGAALVGLALVAFGFWVVVERPSARPPVPPVAVAELKKALREAYSQDLPNPYGPVLAILRRDGTKLPILWRARALERYGVYLIGRGRFGYPRHGIARAYRVEGRATLLRALRLRHHYGNALAALAFSYMPNPTPESMKTFYRYLAMAGRADPENACIEYMRTVQIFEQHAVRTPFKTTTPQGDLLFSSRRWARAYCYRALLCLKYWSLRTERHVWGGRWGARGFLRPALKYYEPKQLAELDAGVWKPGPCPDPWPPPEKTVAKAPPATRPTH